MIYTLISNTPVWKKEEPNKQSRNIGVIKPGDIIQSNIEKDGWLKISGGWVYSLNRNGESIFTSNIESLSKLREPVKNNIYFDDENAGTPSQDTRDWFPDTQSQWEENGTKYTITKNDDGTFTRQVVSKSETGQDQIDTYIMDGNGNVLSARYESGQSNGYRNTTIIDTDGSKTEIRYNTEGDTRERVVTSYDKDGNLTGEEKEPLDSETRTPDNGITDNEAVELLNAVLGDDGSYTFGKMKISNTYGILGCPYQYLDVVDRPIGDGEIGRMFADRILSKMPLLFIQPGEPKFLAGWSDDERGSYLESVLQGLSTDSQLSNFSNIQGRFYTFNPTWALYRQYIQPLTFAAALYLGLPDLKIPHVGSLYNTDWSDYAPEETKKIFFKFMTGVTFYINSEVQITDNFSNSTNQSQLEQKTNALSDMAKELQFLLGSAASKVGVDVNSVQAGSSMNVENAHEFASDLLGRGNFLEQISHNLLTVVQGGKLIFPEIWGDSTYEKSYNVTIKLRCPDADALSWFFNIWLPIAHLLPLVLPKASGPNGYIAPFLVRAWYKGLFQCPMGIITSCSMTRGELGNWNLNGLPMSVDINLTIKDLYHSLAVVRSSTSWNQMSAMENIGILDFIANFCGANMYESDIERTIKFYIKAKSGIPEQLYNRFGNYINNEIQNRLQSMFSRGLR